MRKVKIKIKRWKGQISKVKSKTISGRPLDPTDSIEFFVKLIWLFFFFTWQQITAATLDILCFYFNSLWRPKRNRLFLLFKVQAIRFGCRRVCYCPCFSFCIIFSTGNGNHRVLGLCKVNTGNVCSAPTHQHIFLLPFEFLSKLFKFKLLTENFS